VSETPVRVVFGSGLNDSQKIQDNIMASLMFYQEPVALEKKKHVDLKMKRQTGYPFARNINSVPVAGTEFFQASRDYPVLFIKNDKGEYMPMAILSLRKEAHDMGDNWEDVYIPAFIRRYPFILTTDKVIMFDKQAPHFAEENQEDGEALFEEENKPTEMLKQVVSFLEAVDAGFRMTEEFAKAVAEKELFEPYNATVKFDGSSVKLNDLYCINEKKLHEALSQEEVAEWFKKGWIAWCHAHLHSLSSVSELVKRLRKTQAEEARAKAN